MLRVPFRQYLERRTLLTHEYSNREAKVFAILSPHQQWDLYEYFEPHQRLTEAQLKEHQAGTQRDPSLPHRACKAFKQLEPLLASMGQYGHW